MNIRSLPRNFEFFHQYMDCLKHKLSIIGVSETWYNSITCDLYPIEGYQSIHSYRQERRGGEVMMYVDENIQFQQRTDLRLNISEVDDVFIEFNGKFFGPNHNVIVGTVYRPPATDLPQFNLNLNDLLDSLKAERKTCYILGDF